MKTTAISVSKRIYSILSSDQELKNYVGKNIFPLIADDSVTFPFIIFKKTNVSTYYTKDLRTYDEVQFSILIVSNTYVNGVTIAERVREIIECCKDEVLIDTRLLGVDEDYIDDSFVQELSFKTIIK